MPKKSAPRYPRQLSGGQRRQLQLRKQCRAVRLFLIADEPTSKLDAGPADGNCRSSVADSTAARDGDSGNQPRRPTLFAGFADRIEVMYAGRVVEAGMSAEIFGQPLHPYTQALVRIAASSVIKGWSAKDAKPLIDGESLLIKLTNQIGSCFEPRCSERMDICSRRYPQAFMPEPSRPVNCFKDGE